MYALKARDHYPISVDSVIFGYTEGKLKVALVERKKPPFAGMWAIPGGFMEGEETVEETARRELKEETNIEVSYLEQFHVFNKVGRDPRGPTVTIALFALMAFEECRLVASGDASSAVWWPAYELPVLAFDHNEIYEKALESLRIAVRTRPLAFELLPKQFTLSDLQNLYEQIFHIKLDKRNFRKKISTLTFIEKTGAKTQGGRQRPAMLYQYNAKCYKAFAKENIFS